MTPMRSALLLLLATSLLSACEQPPTDRSGKLLLMAGEEAASITSKLDRLTRQLNIAFTQLNTGRTADADKTLLLARDTLTSTQKGDLDDFHRIAAWTSISQLARRAKDRDLALKSADNALAALNDVQPAAQRPQYVLSLAAELADLQGKPAAIELVNSGGTWAAEIVEPALRRQALVTFTDRLLAYDAFENARTMIRRDPDPAWRTDTFLALANPFTDYLNLHNQMLNPAQVGRFSKEAPQGVPGSIASFGGGAGGGGRGGAAMASEKQQQFTYPSTPDASPPVPFGKDVRFENVYQQK